MSNFIPCPKIFLINTLHIDDVHVNTQIHPLLHVTVHMQCAAIIKLLNLSHMKGMQLLKTNLKIVFSHFLNKYLSVIFFNVSVH